ncbi:MAG: hypothetical protein EXS04_04170 [Phycisphaerales bacterium]|nr:hypothetical protein [Phycisphaerales bacterium]PHX78294.1 MAG: hypothetical protein CK544_03585 [Planctomycetaceae bacterium]
MKNTAAILCASSALLIAAPAWSAMVTVGPGGTANGFQYGQISDAIAAAAAGDTIHAAGRSVYGSNFRYAAFDLESGADGLELIWGNSPGVIEVDGNLKVGANSTMVFELTGTNNSRALTTGRVDYDTVLVYGNMILNGIFNVSLGSTFTPSVGNRFELASTTGSITWSGTLGLHLSLPVLTAGQSWSTTVESGGLLGGQSLFVTVVPAPGAVALLGAATLVGGSRRRR